MRSLLTAALVVSTTVIPAACSKETQREPAKAAPSEPGGPAPPGAVTTEREAKTTKLQPAVEKIYDGARKYYLEEANQRGTQPEPAEEFQPSYVYESVIDGGVDAAVGTFKADDLE